MQKLIVDLNSRWFILDCHNAFKHIEKICNNLSDNKPILVNLQTFLLFLYHFENQKKEIEVKITKIDSVLGQGPYLFQEFDWHAKLGKLYQLMIIASLKSIKSYPGIDNHCEILRKTGLLI